MLMIMIVVVIVLLAFINSFNKKLHIFPQLLSASAKMDLLMPPSILFHPSITLYMLIALSGSSFTPHLPGKLTFLLQLVPGGLSTLDQMCSLGSHVTRAFLLHNSRGEQSYRSQSWATCQPCPYLSSVSLCHNFFFFFFYQILMVMIYLPAGLSLQTLNSLRPRSDTDSRLSECSSE